MRMFQGKIAMFSMLCVSLSLPFSLALATSMGIVGGARNGIGNSMGRPASSLRASDIDLNSSSGSASSKRIKRRKKTAVIVGGGPAGLATALVLSNVKKPGNGNGEESQFFERIIILDEALEKSYDPTRSYFFNINRRGQKFADAFNIDLSKRGSPVTEFAVQYVPSDPKEIFDGTNPKTALMTDKEKENLGTVYWIPRHDLIGLITDEIDAKNDKLNGNAIIEFRRGVCCEYIESTEDDLVKIVTRNKSAEISDGFIVADLCVGADGMSSKVRQSLEDGRFAPEKWSNAKNPSKKFRLKKYASPSTGLRIKGLRIDPDFSIPKGGTESDSESQVHLETRYSYILQSTTKRSSDVLRLSIFPQKDPHSTSGRPVNIITQSSHDLWDRNKIRRDDGGRSVKAYFAKAHPRYDWDKLVTEKEWERFATSKGSIFPSCQYAPSMYVSSNPCHNDGDAVDTEEGGGAGVVLIGDALHSFPPDLGQGVNTAFCDALLLGKSFEEASASTHAGTSKTKATNSFVPEALKTYQEKNAPETRALIALARCGAPFQYYQASMIKKFRKGLWTLNIALRLLLNKITNGLSPKPALMLMMDPNMSFYRVMKKANTLTAVLWSSLLVVFLSLLRARIKV